MLGFTRLGAMTKHILMVVGRIVAALVVCCSLAYSHMKWGEPYPGDGQQAFGFLLVFMVIGLVAAVVYFVLGCTLHFFFRKRRALYVLLSDSLLFAIFAGLLVFAGVAATYSLGR